MKSQSYCYALAALAPLVAALAGCGSSSDDSGGVPTDTDSAELKICSKAECGPAPALAILCSDGSTGGTTGRCVRTKATACHWEMRECPPPTKIDCTAPGACSGPPPLAASQLCKDGSTAGPTCVDTGGQCGWQITECPPVPPELACGANTCTKGQTCCDGMPFQKPTCVDGMQCPISQRQHKKNISYLSEMDRQRLNDELMGFRLATYRYKSESSSEREHLGFIIDDVAPSPAVLESGERVDMYGYQTMAVAALQTQATEMAKLRREVEVLKTTCAAKKSH